MSGRRRHSEEPRVVIIGCGMGGVAAAVKLIQAGVRSFTILEKSSGVGGTWWDNRYPGAATDTTSGLYAYSFIDYPWRGTHASQSELQQYLELVVDTFDFRDRIRLNVEVRSVAWQDASHTYLVTDAAGKVDEYDVVVSAVGMLNVPRYPSWPGLADFVGPRFHTARWEDHDLAEKRVAVVGTGSTSAQVVPALAGVAGHLVVFQREPGWILPKEEKEFSARARARGGTPIGRRLRKLREFIEIERGLVTGMFDASSRTNRRLRRVAEELIATSFADRPHLREAMTPRYDFLCKRAVKSSTFYEAFLREDVELVPHAVASVTESGILDTVGSHHEVDVIVMATGFEPVNYLGTISVTGRDGRDLHEEWAGEPEAFLGIGVPGFPNLYLLYGPNTNGGVIVFNLERQAEFMVRGVKRMMRSGVTALEVRESVHRRYNRWLQQGMEGTVMLGTCHNYFRAFSGKVVTQWPYTASTYWLLTRWTGRVALRTLAAPGSVTKLDANESITRGSGVPACAVVAESDDRLLTTDGAP